jgi:type II secretory pathway predicted ATPase ExeA
VLSQAPGEESFNLSKPDPRLAFTTRNGTKALGLLAEALKKRAGIVVVSGEPGVGKTMLLRKFSLAQRDSGHAIFQPSEPAGSIDALLKAVCAQIGTAPSSSDRIAHLYALREHVEGRVKSGDFCAIIVDGIDGVPDAMLRDLALMVDLERSNMRPIQIVLSGTAKLIDRLNAPEFNAARKEVGAVVKVEPFERDETGAYLQHCLAAAGYKGPALFSFSAVERIHTKTRGVPRAINQVAVTALAALKAAGGKLSSDAIDTAVASALNDAPISAPAPVLAPPPPPPPPVPSVLGSEIAVTPSTSALVGQPQTMTVRMMLDKLDREFAPAESTTAPEPTPAPPPAPVTAPEPEIAVPQDARAATDEVMAEAARTVAASPEPVAAPVSAPAAEKTILSAAELAAEALAHIEAEEALQAQQKVDPPPAPAAETPAPAPEKAAPSAADLVAEALAMVDAEDARQDSLKPAAAAPVPAPVVEKALPRIVPQAPAPAPASGEAKAPNSVRQRLLARLTGG